MRNLPEHYYNTMYLDGYTPEQILKTARRNIREAYEMRAEGPANVVINAEVKTK